jgi:lambda repressor-like predicted transcriptional regulator
MKPYEIKAEIHNKGFSCAMLARTLGTSPNAISGVINRHTTSTRIATAIAKVVGKPVTEVFPDVGTYDGSTKSMMKQQRVERAEELRQLLAS